MKIDFMKDCKKVELGEICEMFSGGTPDSENKDYYNGDIPFIRSAEISGNKTLLYLSESGYNNSSAKMVDYGDLLYALYGANSGECAISKQCGAINQAILCIRSKNESISYIYYILLNKKKRIISKYLQGGQGNLSAAIIKKIKINLPPIEEQEKIAEILSTQDKFIELKQKLVDRKKQQKKWLMQNLLTGKIRLKGFEGEWEKVKLGEIGSTYAGLSGKTKEDFGHGKAKYIPYINIFNNTFVDVSALEDIEVDEKQNCVKKGDVFFTTSSETPEEVGMSSVLLQDVENTYLNSFCFGYRPEKIFDSIFLAFMLRSDLIRKQFKILAQGISRFNISKTKAMEDISIYIPVLEEQTAIAKILSAQDKEIELLEKELEQEKLKKKALMQLLLTVK